MRKEPYQKEHVNVGIEVLVPYHARTLWEIRQWRGVCACKQAYGVKGRICA